MKTDVASVSSLAASELQTPDWETRQVRQPPAACPFASCTIFFPNNKAQKRSRNLTLSSSPLPEGVSQPSPSPSPSSRVGTRAGSVPSTALILPLRPQETHGNAAPVPKLRPVDHAVNTSKSPSKGWAAVKEKEEALTL